MRGTALRAAVIAAALVVGGTVTGATAAVTPAATSPSGPPVFDPAFASSALGAPCTPVGEYETHLYGTKPRYGDACKRITFLYGPIMVKPGQMDAPIEPVTIQKPRYDGYVTRFKPDLVTVKEGKKTQTDLLHLHHATWLNAGNSYGDGPFFAAGEEKTVGMVPDGYGMAVSGSDQWLLLYMVHNALANTEQVYISYEIDFVEKKAGDALGIVPVKPLWLDVQKKAIASGAPSTSSNPVFNVQRGFGHIDPETQRMVCTWPKENCARQDVYGNVTPQQGIPTPMGGQDYTVPAGMAGTIVGLGGHLHPGSLRDEVDVIRDGVVKPAFVSDAVYWDPKNPARAGGPANSWNLSMTMTGAQAGWKVKIKPGDKIRINTVTDSQDGSWYENMGIVVAFVAVNDPIAPAGVDLFDDNVILDRGTTDKMLRPEGPWSVSGWSPGVCHPDLTSAVKRLCLRGGVTHPAVPESGNYGGCPTTGCVPVTGPKGQVVTDIPAVNFTYGPADMGVVGATGIPQLKKGVVARFDNLDAPLHIPHTFTRCAAPCTGATGVDYPIANGGTGATGVDYPIANGGTGAVDDLMDFDSTQVGYGIFTEPASGQIGGGKSPDEILRDGAYFEFTPSRTGTYTFFCRIHPSMRGVFEVVQ